MDDKLAKAVKAAAGGPSNGSTRQVRPASKKGRKVSDTTTPAVPVQLYGPSELAALLEYHRDSVYEWEKQGLEREPGTDKFRLSTVLRWLMAKAARDAAPQFEDIEEAIDLETLRLKRAQADMREDERDVQRKKLIEVELAVAVYQDDAAHVARHLRDIGAAIMQDLAASDDKSECRDIVNSRVEAALNHLNSDHVDPNCADCHPLLGGVIIEGRA